MRQVWQESEKERKRNMKCDRKRVGREEEWIEGKNGRGRGKRKRKIE